MATARERARAATWSVLQERKAHRNYEYADAASDVWEPLVRLALDELTKEEGDRSLAALVELEAALGNVDRSKACGCCQEISEFTTPFCALCMEALGEDAYK